MAKLTPGNTEKKELTQEQINTNLQQEVERLGKMLEATWDTNKIKDFNRRTSQPKNYSYSMGLWEMEGSDDPLIIKSWRMTKDYVTDNGKITEQKMELTLEGAEDESEKKVTIDYVDFWRKLKRTPKIEALKIFDDEGNSYVTRKDDLWNKLLVVPTAENFEWNYEGKDLFSSIPAEYKVILPYNGKEYTMSVKFLNV